MEKKHKIKTRKNKKPKLLIVSSSSSNKKKTKTIKKPKLLLVESPPSENEKIDLKISERLKVPIKMEQNSRLNEKFIDMLEKLSKIMLSRGELHRARAYQKAQETIMAFPESITEPVQLKGKPGIGSTIMEKMNEFIETGTLKILEREKENPVNIFAEIYGVGPKKAKELVDEGITSIIQLRKRPEELNDIQRIGLKYYEDILKRIPRSEIVEYDKIFSEVFARVRNSDANLEIVGSYRRGAETSGDIDVIITSTDGNIFRGFVDELIEKNIILEVLSRGSTKCLVITKIPGSSFARRVDFLYTSPEEYPFSVLYFTGSKIFNTVMRHQAQVLGYSMNEHGMYKMEGKKKGAKVDHFFNSEKDIFDFLGIEFKDPAERTDGRAVVLKATEQPQATLSITGPFQLKDAATKIVKPGKKKPTLVIEEENVVLVAKQKTLKKRENGKKLEVDTKKNRLEVIEDESVILDLTQDFKKNGISVLENLSESQLSKMLNIANIAYRNMEPIMTDNEYDIIQEYAEAKFPENKIIKKIGAPVEKNKAVLPYEMGSMDKIKPDSGALTTWMQKYKGPYVLSCKLDGVSGLYTSEGKEPKLYTRGDGKVGQDVSYLIPFLRLPKNKNIVIRGEFIMPKKIFETKYKAKFANPRNLVSGIVNRVTIDEKAKDVSFVAYEVIKPELTPSEQMKFLKTLEVDIVMNKIVSSLTNEMLSDLLVEWRKNYVYEIDGVIVTDDVIVARKSGNPDQSFAFKMVLSDQTAEAKVVDVLWSPSKDGYLKPRVRIEPLRLGGVKIEYATGFNAAFIEEKKIGLGAIIQLIRSGDVIPYIKDVTSPAENPKMPNVAYKWNDTHVDIILEDMTQDIIVKEKNITGFFRGIGVEGLSSGNILRIMDTGNDTIPKIIRMSKADFLKVEGFKEKLATKIFEGIKKKLADASLLTIMSASNIFGRGISEKKIEPILEMYPDILTSTSSSEEKIQKVMKVKGMAKKTAELFVRNIEPFLEFAKECQIQPLEKVEPKTLEKVEPKMLEKVEPKTLEKVEPKTLEKVEPKNSLGLADDPLKNSNVVITGFRDEALVAELKKKGVKMGTSVNKNTFAVLVKNKDEKTGKANAARKLGIPFYTPEEFKTNYFI